MACNGFYFHLIIIMAIIIGHVMRIIIIILSIIIIIVIITSTIVNTKVCCKSAGRGLLSVRGGRIPMKVTHSLDALSNTQL